MADGDALSVEIENENENINKESANINKGKTNSSIEINGKEGIITEFSSLLCKVAENHAEPSALFINNLNSILRIPKATCIQHLQQMDNKTISVLREQLFTIFIDTFDTDILISNGFNFPDHVDPKSMLKKRTSMTNAAYDIYNISLSIWEKCIVGKLALDILKPSSFQQQQVGITAPPQAPILDSHSKQILEKLHQIIDSNTIIQHENKELKLQIQNLQKKIDHLIDNQCICTTTSQQQQQKQHMPITILPQETPLQETSNNEKSQSQMPAEIQVIDRFKYPSIPNPPNSSASEHQQPNMPQNIPGTSPSYASITSKPPTIQNSRTNSTSKPTTTQIPQTSTQRTQATPKNKSDSRKNVVFGSKATGASSSKKVVAPSRPLSLFIGGFSLDMNQEEIKNYIENEANIQVLNIELNKVNGFNKSYKVDINIKDKDKAFDPTYWHQGIIIKLYRQRINTNHNSQKNTQKYNTRNNTDEYKDNDDYDDDNDYYNNSNKQNQDYDFNSRNQQNWGHFTNNRNYDQYGEYY